MYICKYCHRECKNINGLHKHERHCKRNPNYVSQPTPVNDFQELYCKYCSKQCKNVNSLKNHERLCPKNSDRSKLDVWKNSASHLSNQGWAKGLTALTDDRVKRAAENSKLAIAELRIKCPEKFSGKAKSPDSELKRRAKISETLRKNPNSGGLRPGSGRGKKGWYKGFFCDSTYELVYVIYNIDHDISFSKCQKHYKYEYKGKIHRYYPDFELADGTIVEIKGYHSKLVDIKSSSVFDRPIIVLYEKDLKYAFDWVKQHYTYKCLSDLYENK